MEGQTNIKTCELSEFNNQNINVKIVCKFALKQDTV